MTSKFRSGINLEGHLRVIARNAVTGAIVRRISIRNTITYKALDAVVQLISQLTSVTPTDHKIAQLRVGTGTTPPVRGDTALQTQVSAITLTDANKVLTVSDPFELKILATLVAGTDSDPFNGVTLSEAGLFTGAGNMFARQIYPGISKTSALVVDYDWRIDFTA